MPPPPEQTSLSPQLQPQIGGAGPPGHRRLTLPDIKRLLVCVAHSGIQRPRAKAAKRPGGDKPPHPGAGFLPHAATLRQQLQYSFGLGWAAKRGGMWWVIRRGGTQGRERGGEQPPELQRANSSPKGEFRSRRSRVSSRLALQPWKASLAGTRSVSPRSWRPPRGARSL